MSDLEGVMLSEYLLLKCISKSGVADVYRARQSSGGNYEVAVKVFRPSYAQQKAFRDYFMVEAEKVGYLDHPNILPFLEFGEGEGLLYTVMPFVLTGTLEDLLARVGGKFPAMQALPIMQQIGNAVHYAHEQDVTHGNIKPTNVFVGADGRVLLSDFGIARGYDDSQQSLTRVGWGSAEYAAPEQSLGVLRRSSDIYTLGVLLFRMLTGQAPFTGQTPVEVLLKHVRQETPSTRSLEPTISDAVDSVVQRAMQKRSDDRFPTVQAFCDALTEAVMVAPVASPVAKPVVTVRQTGPLSQPLPMLDPHTPVPALPSTYRAPLVPRPLSADTATWLPPTPATESHVSAKSPSTSNFLLDDDDDFGTGLFEWGGGPVEWSPIASHASAAASHTINASTASEYLQGMPVIPEAPRPVAPVFPVSPQAPAAPSALLDASRKAQQAKSQSVLKKKAAHPALVRLKAILPAAVVILLVLGLVTVLLSSFLWH